MDDRKMYNGQPPSDFNSFWANVLLTSLKRKHGIQNDKKIDLDRK